MNNEILGQLFNRTIKYFRKTEESNKSKLKIRLQKNTRTYKDLSHIIKELENQKVELAKRITELKLELSQLLTKRYQYVDEITRLESIEKAFDKEYTTLKSKKASIESEVQSLSFRKDMLEQEIFELESKVIELNLKNQATINNLSLDYIDNIADGLEFEKFFASLLNQLGYNNVQVTPGSGDFGIDVIAEKDEIKYGFQCKLYSSPVGVEAVQEAIAGQKHHSCNLAVVVTNNTFTPQAKQLALESLIALWDRKKLSQLIKEVQKNN